MEYVSSDPCGWIAQQLAAGAARLDCGSHESGTIRQVASLGFCHSIYYSIWVKYESSSWRKWQRHQRKVDSCREALLLARTKASYYMMMERQSTAMTSLFSILSLTLYFVFASFADAHNQNLSTPTKMQALHYRKNNKTDWIGFYIPKIIVLCKGNLEFNWLNNEIWWKSHLASPW